MSKLLDKIRSKDETKAFMQKWVTLNYADEMLSSLVKILRGFERNDCLNWDEIQLLIEKAAGETWEDLKEHLND